MTYIFYLIMPPPSDVADELSDFEVILLKEVRQLPGGGDACHNCL